MPYEVIIHGKFTTGTTQDDPDEAKKTCTNLLTEMLEIAKCAGKDGIFMFQVGEVEVDKL